MPGCRAGHPAAVPAARGGSVPAGRHGAAHQHRACEQGLDAVSSAFQSSGACLLSSTGALCSPRRETEQRLDDAPQRPCTSLRLPRPASVTDSQKPLPSRPPSSNPTLPRANGRLINHTFRPPLAGPPDGPASGGPPVGRNHRLGPQGKGPYVHGVGQLSCPIWQDQIARAGAGGQMWSVCKFHCG